MVGARAGALREHLRGVCKQGLGPIPFPQPNPPIGPVPQPAVPVGRVTSNNQAFKGGSGIEVRGVRSVVALLGVGGQQLRKGPSQPIWSTRECTHTMVAAGGHISKCPTYAAQ